MKGKKFSFEVKGNIVLADYDGKRKYLLEFENEEYATEFVKEFQQVQKEIEFGDKLKTSISLIINPSRKKINIKFSVKYFNATLKSAQELYELYRDLGNEVLKHK